MKSQIFTNWLGVFILILLNHTSFSQVLPKSSILYEAEDNHIKTHDFVIEESLHASAGKFIAQKNPEIKNDSEIFRAEFPEGDYTVWVYSTGLGLEIRGPLLGSKKIRASSMEWGWHKVGVFSEKQMGSSFSIVAVPRGENSAKVGLDCVILTEDVNFVPQGVYTGYSPDAANMILSSQPNKSQSETSTVDIHVFPGKKIYKISKYLASANAHGAPRHLVDSPEWDATMKACFSNNMLCLIASPRRTPDESGLWWDFKAMDEFVKRAKQRWHVDELLVIPAWWLTEKVTGAKRDEKMGEYTNEDLDKGEQLLMQLINRYGCPGPLYIRYWVLEDEWPGVAYWKNHADQFAEYYAHLLRKVKKINPDIKVGGPVDCWPQDAFIANLLEHCPELDFIAWNMFTTGRAETPLKKLFHGAKHYKSYINSSRQLSERILNKKLPVIVTSYGPNFHAWDPNDPKLAQPIIGVWNALVLSYMAEEECFSGMYYDVRAANSGGLFGPADPYAVSSKMLPGDIDKNLINVRPSARVMSFFKKNISGRDFNEVSVTGDGHEFNAISAGNENEVSIVLVNYSERRRNVSLAVESYERTAYSGFQLPDECLYCDEQKIFEGCGLLFTGKGSATLTMAAYSTWCLKLRYKK
ncbi:MAG: hypothetical protein PHV34_19815 [Verrucomicrobiae bacterium]|nr:hypothetical protein [Verrucomicrobiae bacterium]